MNKEKFKVGDRVKLIDVAENPGKGWIISTTEPLTVKNIKRISAYSKTILTVETMDGRWAIVNESDVRRTNEEPGKCELFKEVDLVKAIGEDRESPDIVKGDLLVVRRTQRPADKYILVSKKDDMNFMSIFPKDKIEKVSYEKPDEMTGAVFYRVVEDMTEDDKRIWEELSKNGKTETSSRCESVNTGEGMKNDFLDDKPRWDLLPLPEIEDLVKVYTAGAKKYAPNNWQKLDNGYQRYKAALFRHLLAYEKGERIDPDTKCMHLAQVVWNAVAMLWFDKNGKGLY